MTIVCACWVSSSKKLPDRVNGSRGSTTVGAVKVSALGALLFTCTWVDEEIGWASCSVRVIVCWPGDCRAKPLTMKLLELPWPSALGSKTIGGGRVARGSLLLKARVTGPENRGKGLP